MTLALLFSLCDCSRFRYQCSVWVHRQDERRSRLLVKVEVTGQIAENRLVFPNIRSRIRPSVRLRVESLAMQEIGFDELEISVAAERLMIDVPPPGIGTDDYSGHTNSIPEFIDDRRPHMVVEAAPVVPGEKDRRRVSFRALHDLVDDVGDIRLSDADQRRWMFAVTEIGHHPRNGRQCSIL